MAYLNVRGLNFDGNIDEAIGDETKELASNNMKRLRLIFTPVMGNEPAL